ncbi:hypothetical protein [Dokdonella sp.]|uniref:hypothetical protein n=1 Tax=Dokdonella sp. TaxID=2291710 RepID=UPI002F3EB911
MLAALAGARHFFPDVAQRTTLCFPLVLAALAFSNIVRAGLSQRWTAEDVREWWGRASGIVAMVAFAWLALSLVVIQVPSWLLRWASTWSGWTAGIAGVGSVALAVATTMFGFWSKHGSEVKEKALGVGRALGLRTMEVAAGASVLVIAVALSLVLGLFATNEWFRLDAAAIPSTACTSAPREALRAHAPPMNDLSSLQKREACTVLTGLAASKPALYCTQAATMCGGTCPAQPLPAACNTLEAPANNVADISAGADTQASTSVSPPTSWSSRASSSFPTRMDARANLVDETAIFQQLAAANFALGWLIRHEQSLMDRADRLLLLALALVAFAIGASYLFGANAFSLNAFYGNRLTRAYLGASQPKGKQHPHPFTGFDLNDNLPLKDLAPVVDGQGVRLLPIVNTALNLLQPSGDRLEWQERKAESFFMTPYYCGSKTLGFVSTEHYASRGSAGLSAGRAMAISGAAASPAMGYHSSPLVTLLMAFFNVRLGWWMPNPARQKFWRKEPLFGIGPILSEMLSSVSDKRRFVYLSDGGHFENLGLYEMVRRRCRTILVVDAVCDADYQYEDLEDAVRKIRIDLGVPITFADGLLTPERARATGCHYCTGAIGYSALGEGWEDGRIVYIKPVLSGDEPVDVRHYAETTRSDGRVFPQQPTSDQFFDEAQFESYRELGLHSVIQAFAGAGRGWPRAVPFKSMSAVSTTGDATLRDAPLPKWAPTPPSKESASSGLLGALTTLGPLGQAAMVASITAAFTVTGTVALKDAHVTLNDATVKLAPAEVNLKRDDHPLPVTIDARDVATGVGAFLQSTDPQDRATREALATALAAQLSAIKVKIDVNGTLIDPALMVKIQTLIDAGNGIVVDLKDASKDLKTAGVVLRGQLKPVLESVAKAIETSNGKATALNEGLQQIRQAINKLDGTVDRISPRQTVRGSGS